MSTSDKKIFAAIFCSIFTSVTGLGIVVPLLPVYAHDLGASGLYISLIFGAFSLSRTFLLPYFGRISDIKGRKPFIVAGLLGYTLVSIAFMLSSDVNSLIIIRFLQGIASAMIMPVALAYIGDITPEGREGFYMGLFHLSMFLGLSIGPLAGGVISDKFSLDAAFASMGILASAGCMLSFFLLPPVSSEKIARRYKASMPAIRLLRSRSIAGLFIVRFSYITCIGIIWCFLPVYADSEFGLSGFSIGILVMLGVFISGMLQVPMGFLADRLNKRYMIICGCLIVVYAIYSFSWAEGFRDIIIADIIFGVGGGMSTPPVMALSVIKGNETESMGSVMGLLTMGHSMGMMLGSFFAGIIMDYCGLRSAFPLGATIMMTGILLFIFLTRKNNLISLAHMQK
ncbi:MAG: MFS transporter [Deltaproteobacteria bacterium]|nr:MFS transporter [Deltaproteobacteria bacterium]MBW1947469.1 MFS transporter [Deltaproteobacteria bacterium]MBW1967101.1 MFS transporter [Deltaproteobacteria bacterium]MBW2098214.1 MFS transporter [Deltaproteobacteria bacterium]